MAKAIQKMVASSATAVLLAVPVAVVTSSTATAATGGTCSATRQTQARTGADAYRSRATCSKLNGDNKARAKLVRSAGPDYTGSWFTTLNKSYYTGWYTCYMGCYATYEVAPV